MKRILLIVASIALFLGITALPAAAQNQTRMLPNGCQISAFNSFSSGGNGGTFTGGIGWNGGTCYNLRLRMTYLPSGGSFYVQYDSGYITANVGSFFHTLYNVTPIPGNNATQHSAQATAGGTEWGFGMACC